MITNDEILETVAESARQQLNTQGAFLNDFFSTMKRSILDHAIMSNSGAIGTTNVYSLYLGAAEFETFAANSVIITDMFNEGIDEFFDNPENAPLFDGMDKEQLSERRRALKDFAAEKLELHPETEQGRQFVQALKEEFHNTVTAVGNERATERLNFMEGFTAPLKGAMKAMINASATDILKSAESAVENRTEKFAFDALAKNAKYFAGEQGIVDHAVKEILMTVENDKSVMPHEFLEHYRQRDFVPTQEESKWTASVFEQITKGEQVDFSRFYIGSKQFFNQHDLNLRPPFQGQLKTDLVAAILSGEEVSILNPEDNTLSLINPRIVDERKEHRTFIDKVIDFFKDLLGIGKTKEKETQEKISGLQDKMQNVKERFEGRATAMTRSQISLDELMGIDDIKKVVPTAAKTDPEKTKSDPSRSM